ncbi:MAG: potassium-transporting ATPase subunit KdpC [Cryobacterium sp.]|nr:potassium-transporting ATPase subunit KdpC [Oligoflexia bacterium]
MKQSLFPAIRIYLFFTILLGLAYPYLMTGISQVVFAKQASGEFLSRGGQLIGAKLIGQKFEKPEYFWPRPSAVDYNPLPSGGTNLGPTSADLKKAVDERRVKMKAANPDSVGEPPQDLLFASASGLDPQISVVAAEYQAPRIAKARKLPQEKVGDIIKQNTESRQLGILGEVFVNVLTLNLALDHAQGIDTAPVLLPVATPSATATPGPTESHTS